jgi:Holliday junction resolvase RusA-like endonuclease
MIIFEIHSVPKAQKQTQFARGRAYDPSKIEKEAIQWQIRPYAPKEPYTGPVSLDITFCLPIPTSTGRSMQKQMANNSIAHTKKPDIDNLSYLVVNAMKDIIYRDDSQIVSLSLNKRYSDDPKTVVKVREL